MKTHSIQYRFLTMVISAILAVAIFIGGLSFYEVDLHIRAQTEDFIRAACEKEATQINDFFGGLQKSVSIMESYVLDLIESREDIENRDKLNQIIAETDRMFANVAKNTSTAITYYLRINPEIADHTSGLFYERAIDEENYTRFENTDLSIYDKDDIEHVGWFWQPYEAGKPIWMKPYHNLNTDVWMISYVIPLFYEDLFVGVVGMDFDYAVLIDRIRDIRIYENGFAHLEMDGVYMHHSEYEPGAKIVDDSQEYWQTSQELVNGMTLVLSASYKDILEIRYHIAHRMILIVLLAAALFSVIVAFVVRRMVKPLQKLTEAAVRLTNGNYDVESIPSDTYEIKMLSAAFEKMTVYLREHEKLQHLLAYRDSLTGLRNTTSYKSWVKDFEKELQSEPADYGVIVLDINCLKETNDKHGHDTGNKLIIAAARIIATTFKRSPVFRIGGDEFVVILRNSDLECCEELIEKLDSQCANTSIDAGSSALAVSVARGLARYDAARDTQFVDVFNRADEEMYKHKREIKAKRAK